VSIDVKKRAISFSPDHCGKSCLPCGHAITASSTRIPRGMCPSLIIDGIEIQALPIGEFCELI
jgi:hypothetical protein